MKNKQKQWRRAATLLKQDMIAKGKHEKGARYGRSIKAYHAITFKGVASTLFQRMMLNVNLWHDGSKPA